MSCLNVKIMHWVRLQLRERFGSFQICSYPHSVRYYRCQDRMLWFPIALFAFILLEQLSYHIEMDFLRSSGGNTQNKVWFDLSYWTFLSTTIKAIHLLLTQSLNYKMIHCHPPLEKDGSYITEILRSQWRHLAMDNGLSDEKVLRYHVLANDLFSWWYHNFSRMKLIF
jgi:hypothetical protein